MTNKENDEMPGPLTTKARETAKRLEHARMEREIEEIMRAVDRSIQRTVDFIRDHPEQALENMLRWLQSQGYDDEEGEEWKRGKPDPGGA